MTSRRQFLKNAALVTAGVLAANSSIGSPLIAKRKKVIIIGAGFSGLSAAYHLQKKGIDFEILESRPEVGGRVFSYPIDPSNNLVIELGAEWVGEDHTLLRSLCEKFNLPLDNDQFNSQAIYKGKYYPDATTLTTPAWDEKFKQLLTSYRNLDERAQEALGKKLDLTDWWRYLVENGCAGTDLDMRELTDSTDFGESIRQVSAYSALDEYAKSSPKSKNEMDYKIRGGNQQLAFYFKSLFADKIKTNHVVESIEQHSTVKVRCSNGYTTEGDKLICTAPTFAATRIKWDPVLPEKMQQAMSALQYARINKNALLFSRRFWNDESFDMITDQPGHYFYHATKNQPSTKGVLISYTIGDKAAVIANQEDTWRADIAAISLGAAFPNVRSLVESQVNYYWGNDLRSMGAYAMYGKGQWFDLFGNLNREHQHVIFAGEHLSENWQGFMEGALETGKAAAEKI